MITKIGLNCIASYKNLAALETDKKINLIYGLNGTGKSTLSNFFYDKTDEAFSSCSLEGLNEEQVLVYNQKFIQDYFYESENLNGIFTLSKENKNAENIIKNCRNEITKLEQEKINETGVLNNLIGEQTKKKQYAENKVWELKTTFSGGDRVLEFCLEGLKGKKENLFNHISVISKPEQKPGKTTDKLKKEVESLQGENAQHYSPISIISCNVSEVESNSLFQKEIIGNENSTVAALIKKLDNSDWVKQGIGYLPEKIDDNFALCPFCQEKTITENVIANIKKYFDETYEKDIVGLKKLNSEYEAGANSIPLRDTYTANPFIVEKKTDFENLYDQILKVLNSNKRKIEKKLKTPSQKINLDDSKKAIENLNQFINGINIEINAHNQKIDNKKEALNQIRNTFWSIMRWDYDQTLSSYQNDVKKFQKDIAEINKNISEVGKKISSQKETINIQQKNTVNIDEAIANINNGLIELGIDDFRIVKHSDILYKIIRDEKSENTFRTLSEGEKMIISFLYFRELCKGKKTATEIENNKIIVIDDPISSLSHIYIFNIGQLIKKEFFNSEDYEQIFVLTHSLYFFYELTDVNRTRRKENQKLFRMIKNSTGSQILEMKYEEIQNDYHSYWHIVKDEKQSPALIANCMRNIIEYFFNFIEKQDLNNVFQKPSLQDNKYQAFYRYINRESHSLGQNIFDYKEFNYSDFKDALGLVFKENGYHEHYVKMMK